MPNGQRCCGKQNRYSNIWFKKYSYSITHLLRSLVIQIACSMNMKFLFSLSQSPPATCSNTEQNLTSGEMQLTNFPYRVNTKGPT